MTSLVCIAPKIEYLDSVVYAENQPPYIPLPVSRTVDGEVVSCWKPNIWARFKILFGGNFYITMLIFNRPLTPLRVSVDRPKYKLVE